MTPGILDVHVQRLREMFANSRKRGIVLAIGVIFVLSFGLYSRSASQSGYIPARNKVPPSGAHWSSFDNVTTFFAFGDSWSSHKLQKCKLAASAEDFNPSRPFPATYTSTNGPNWVGFISHVFNRSAFHLYDLALAGSTVDTTIVEGAWGLDFRFEVTDLLGDEGGIERCQWMPDTIDSDRSLFAVFFGMNDIMGCRDDTGCDIYNPPTAKIFDSYKQSLSKLYRGGARNFLLLNAPPGSPDSAYDSPSSDDLIKAQTRATKLFNEAHKQLAQWLRAEFQGTTVFEVDVWGLFHKVYHGRIEEVPFAGGIKNLAGWCPSYSFVTLQDGSKVTPAQIESCGGLRPEEYAWNGALHATWPMHQAIASEAVRVMDEYQHASHSKRLQHAK